MSKHQMGLWRLALALLVAVGSIGVSGLPAHGGQGTKVIRHQVSRGQNLWTIAQRYGIGVQELADLNKLNNPNLVHPGQTLLIRAGTAITPEEALETDYSFSKREMELLARLIHAEARGEDFQGQVAVGAVVLNRLKHPKFPKSLYEVIYQPGAFTATRDKQMRLEPDEVARIAAKAAVKGMDPTGGALFYYNPNIARDPWIKTRPVLKVIGNHTFAS